MSNVADNLETQALDENIVKIVRAIEIVVQFMITDRSGGLILLPHVGFARSRIQLYTL